MMAEFVVIGLGIFGRNVALHLARAGHTVLAVDSMQSEVDRIATELTSAVRADATDEEALQELGLDRMSCAVVAIGADSMEASILATALLRQIGVPRIIARSLSELHSRVLRAAGAHEIVNPEEEMGQRLARRLTEPSIRERLSLGGDAEFAEVEIPAAFVDKTPIDLDIRRRYGLTVVAIRRQDRIQASLREGDRFREGDVMLVIGTAENIQRVAALA
jgi:trk system potassium uptake protein TrkA